MSNATRRLDGSEDDPEQENSPPPASSSPEKKAILVIRNGVYFNAMHVGLRGSGGQPPPTEKPGLGRMDPDEPSRDAQHARQGCHDTTDEASSLSQPRDIPQKQTSKMHDTHKQSSSPACQPRSQKPSTMAMENTKAARSKQTDPPSPRSAPHSSPLRSARERASRNFRRSFRSTRTGARAASRRITSHPSPFINSRPVNRESLGSMAENASRSASPSVRLPTINADRVILEETSSTNQPPSTNHPRQQSQSEQKRRAGSNCLPEPSDAIRPGGGVDQQHAKRQKQSHAQQTEAEPSHQNPPAIVCEAHADEDDDSSSFWGDSENEEDKGEGGEAAGETRTHKRPWIRPWLPPRLNEPGAWLCHQCRTDYSLSEGELINNRDDERISCMRREGVLPPFRKVDGSVNQQRNCALCRTMQFCRQVERRHSTWATLDKS